MALPKDCGDQQTQALIGELDLNMLPHIRRTPLVLSGLFLELTRALWMNENNICPNTRTWSPTNEKDHVFVESSYEWDSENTDRRPAIIVDIGDLEVTDSPAKGIGADSGMVGFDLQEGMEFREDLIIGSVVWAHIGVSRGQVLVYGSCTYDLLAGFSSVIRRDFCLEKFNVRGILKPRLRKEQPRTFECLVQASFQFKEDYSLKRESPKLKQIRLEFETDSLTQAGNLVR
jgi:hypothetical protein